MGGLFGGGAPSFHTEDPIIAAMRINTSAYGKAIALCYGKSRVAGNLIWYNDFTAIPHTTTSSGGGGGKGGGGGGSSSQTSYTYTAAAIMGLCEGVIGSIGSIWAGKTKTDATTLGLSVYTGTPSQTPFGFITTNHPGEALNYRRLAYVATGAYDLGDNASLPNHTFEIDGLLPFSASIRDALPSDILVDYLSDAYHGAGFPAGKIGNLTQWANYCTAAGLFVSPAYTSQEQASEALARLFQCGNAAPFSSEGMLKVVPYGDTAITGNGVTYTPANTAQYALTDDDFLGETEDPVIVLRGNPADAFNQVQVKYTNRLNQYNDDVVEAKDQANIELYGLRPMQPIDLGDICDINAARAVAQIALQRSLYIRNTYRFTLGWKYCLLEPMDIVTLTEGSGTGLSGVAVRITLIEETDAGEFNVEAEDFIGGIASHVAYPTQQAGGYSTNYNQSPGSVVPPAFFERRVGKQISIGIAVTGNSALWGGCNVWVSRDDSTYKRVANVTGRARYGSLNATIGSGTSDTIDVQLAGIGGELLSGTAADADQFTTECFVDGEIVAYQTAAMTGTNRYSLSGLNRGGFGTTAASHLAGSTFIRVDDAIVDSDPLDVSMVGQSLWFKFTSYNVFGGGQQGLSEARAFQYIVKGTPLYTQPANVQNIVDVFRDGRTMLTWDVVLDDRDVDYEIRKGATWATAQVLGRTPNTEFVTDGDGTYWVAAHADQAYSATPASITLAGSVLVANVVATYDEEATLWGGSLSGGAMVLGTDIVLAGAGSFSAIPLLSGVSSVFYFGGISSSGSYTVPALHEVDVGTSQPCNCSVSYRLRADNPYALFSAVPDVAALASMAGDYSGIADAKVQISIAPDSGIYGYWRDFVPGKYVGRKFKFRVLLTSSDPSVTAVLDTLAFTVDMPDRIEKGTAINCPAGGLLVNYVKQFQIVPNVQITIQGAVQNDDVVMTNPTKDGFTVQVQQGGVGVARIINWLAQGY